jgi:hypothetical protein
VAYVVVGGNAVAERVGRMDEAAVRNTRVVEIMIRRSDLGAAKVALEAAGFVYCQVPDVGMFVDGPNGRHKDAVHLIFAGETLRAEYVTPSPDIAEPEPAAQFQVVALEALVRMKLNSYRDRDQTHLRDMIEVGLVNDSWLSHFPPQLATRLQHLLNTPGG